MDLYLDVVNTSTDVSIDILKRFFFISSVFISLYGTSIWPFEL